MALNDHLLHFVVHSTTENTRSRTVYRPRSEQLVEYLAHASKSREDQKSDREREAQRTDNDEQKKEDQRAYIEQRLREIAAFEDRLRPGYRSRRKRN